MANFSNWLELDNEIYQLECLRCNLDVIALGMNHERIEKLIWADRPKEVKEQ